MVQAGCVFLLAGIHPSRIGMPGSFESVRWDTCVHRLDLGLYSHPKEFCGNGVRTHVNSNGKSPLEQKNKKTKTKTNKNKQTKNKNNNNQPNKQKNFPQRRMEPTTLHQAGQRAQHATNELLRPQTRDRSRCPRPDHASDLK